MTAETRDIEELILGFERDVRLYEDIFALRCTGNVYRSALFKIMKRSIERISPTKKKRRKSL